MATPNMFVKSVYVAALAFEDHRRDDPSELYLTHSLDVAQALGPHATALELSTAVLHDILEDSDWTKDELAEAGIEDTILEAVETLTRRPDEEHENFVARICTTPGAVGVTAQRVKLADLSVNLANADSEEERERLERSIPIVRSALEQNRASVQYFVR